MAAALDDLLDTVARLWPDAEEIQVIDRGAVRDLRPSVDLIAVPSVRSPRLLLPDSPRGASVAIRRFSSAVTAREVGERLGMAAALRVLSPRRLFGGVRVVSAGGGITDHLAEVLGQPVTVSLGIGTKRANRKPILQVFDLAGRPLAHVKVGDTATAAGHVRGEAVALGCIASARWDTVRVPRVLHHGSWRGREVLVLSTLPASPWQAGTRRRFPMDAVLEVGRSGLDGEAPLRELPAWTRWADTAGTLSHSEHRDRLSAAIARAEEQVGSTVVRSGAWHGDFTPWNMAWSGRRLSLWDWERYETGVPVGLDVVHYAVNVRVHGAGFTDEAVSAGLTDARALLGDGPSAPALLVTYLVAIAARYLAAAEDEGGEVILASGRIALDQLEDVTRSRKGSAA